MNLPLRTLAIPAALAAALALAACGGTSSTTAATSSLSSSSHDMSSMSGSMSSTTSTSSPATTAAAGAPATGTHNTADEQFATAMIPHHTQAVTMAEMALTQAATAEVKTLATAIKAAQDPEIATMSGWLKGWGKPVPQTMAGHDMSGTGGTSMPGMMSTKQMATLGAASGTSFDTLWLQMMTQHHQGAITMAKTELTSGANTEAKKLAQAIIEAQTKEIAQMKPMMAAL